ncbi:MAG: YqeG family HAD IIIA-type phosphatase [Clostridia bacterium]|nr:YqeG family HAD IIIA-type phosphatase [Clostridia bacterium]
MILYPDLYCEGVTAVTIEILRQHNIKGLILDIDNTLIDYDRNMDEKIKLWVNELKEKGIKFCIVSNTNKVDKVKKVSEDLDIPYFYFAKKPFKKGFLKAKELMGLESRNIAAIGDQIATDILGANRCGMFSILVKPISEKDIFMTKVKRPIEKIIINRYLSKSKKEKV